MVSAKEMHAAVMQQMSGCDIFLAVAAVGDYRCQQPSDKKIHKEADVMNVVLERNPDIAAAVGQLEKKPFIMGFAAETDHVLASAKAKREKKQMDLIVANRVGDGVGMGQMITQ